MQQHMMSIQVQHSSQRMKFSPKHYTCFYTSPNSKVFSQEHLYYHSFVQPSFSACIPLGSSDKLRDIALALSVFAETFQGCYKDGLNGTRDYRMTPAIMMFWILIWTVA